MRDDRLRRPRRQHHEPLLWLVFGAGGMLTALLVPALVLVLGVLLPLGLLPDAALSHARVLAVMGAPLVRVAVTLALAAGLVHCAHRIVFGLHDLKLHLAPAVRALFYLSALGVASVAGVALFTL